MLEKYAKILSDAPSDKTFKTRFGELRNLAELRNTLAEKGQSFYGEFVYNNQNHFSNWVAGVFGDYELAESMKNTNSSEETVKLVDRRIKYLDLWLAFNSGKEQLNKILLNDYASAAGYKEFNPEHHKFETALTYQLELPTLTPPLANNIPSVIKGPERVPEDANKLIPYNKPSGIKPPEFSLDNMPKPNSSDEKKLLRSLEDQFPGLKIIEEAPKQRGFFARLFGRK